jgi:hypothetical protein
VQTGQNSTPEIKLNTLRGVREPQHIHSVLTGDRDRHGSRPFTLERVHGLVLRPTIDRGCGQANPPTDTGSCPVYLQVRDDRRTRLRHQDPGDTAGLLGSRQDVARSTGMVKDLEHTIPEAPQPHAGAHLPTVPEPGDHRVQHFIPGLQGLGALPGHVGLAFRADGETRSKVVPDAEIQ